MWLGLLWLWFAPPETAFSEEAPSPLQRAFLTEVHVRALEEEQALLSDRDDLEDSQKAAESQRISKALSQSRDDLAAILRSDRSHLSNFEQKLLLSLARRGDKKQLTSLHKTQNALDFLVRNHPEASSWTPLEWQVIGDWFGQKTQDAFLQRTFTKHESMPSPLAVPKETLVVWVEDPWLPTSPTGEKAQINGLKQRLRLELQKSGLAFEELGLSPFPRVEDQVESLHLAIAKKADQKKPILLMSSGSGSALLLRAFDLNPALLARGEIVGWLNINGRLFGETEAQTRKPASLLKADRQLLEAQKRRAQMRQDKSLKQIPFKSIFPVWNLINLDSSSRPSHNLRESLLPEGNTVFFSSRGMIENLRRSVPALFSEKTR